LEFAIVDIETTGSQYGADGITEIAIIITDGVRELDRYETLVNPQMRIPKFIVRLTGITDRMVADAPIFSEVAEEIFSFLDGRIFVAHNVNFDYKIVKAHLQKCGITIPTKRLCTVRMSRKIIPGYPSYSLGKISASLGLNHQNAHRAMGDTEVTAKLFQILFEKDKNELVLALKQNSKEATLPANLSKEIYEKVPKRTGVYYFHDAKGKIIYIGKAKNLKKRVTTHFTGKNSIKKKGFIEAIFDVSYELTGNEVIASLLEEAEIKNHWPEYNRSQKSQIQKFGVYKYEDNAGTVRLGINKITHQYKGIMQFPTLAKARTWLLNQIDEYQLNASLCGMAAFDKKDVDETAHQKNLIRFLSNFLANEETIVWHGAGRTKDEIGFVLMEKGIYKGFGFVEDSIGISSLDTLSNYLKPQHDTYFVRNVLSSEKLNTLKKVKPS